MNYLVLLWFAVSTTACQILSGANSLSVEDSPPSMRIDPMQSQPEPTPANVAGKPSTASTPKEDESKAGAGAPGGGMGGAGSSGHGGSKAAAAGGNTATPSGGSGASETALQPCASDSECGGKKCLRQGWCELSCSDNSRCGVSNGGAANLCGFDYPDPTKSFCYAGCDEDSDCEAYPKTVCQTVIGASDMKTCEVPSSAGYPCNNDQNCEGSLICVSSLWCSPNPCTSDSHCGISPRGKQNRCLTAGQTELCAPGCTTKDDCSGYAGTVCRQVGTASVCLPPPAIGSPCQTKADCGDYDCNGAWCTPASCTNNTGCGQTSAGNANQCIENANNNTICFPGCKTNSDCASFEQTSCQPGQQGNSGMICSLLEVGTPCAENAHCGNIGWICAGLPGWCTPRTCVDDSECNRPTASTLVNRCIENVNGTKSCFPGCRSTTECSPYPDTICSDGVCTAF